MESKPAFRSAPLLDRALRIASQRAQTYDSLAESLGVTPEDAALYWFSINSLRRGLGHDLPPLSASARCWYDPTWHLEALLEEFQINEGLASHYGRIFYDPEGGHLELNMAANEVVYAIGLEHPDIDVARLRRVCVHACEPECGIELLAANAGKVLLSIEEYRDEAVTPAFIEMLYARLVAGIEAVPTSYDDLIAAGKAFQEKLGDDYYPLAIGQYDRMILMTFYLESKYGKAWVENNECQYSEEEIVDGLNFIDSLEDNHVIPTRPTMIAAGFDSIDKSQEWIDGKYAGIFEWDSAPSKYQSALADNSGFTVGEEIKFGDKANGGFSKVSMGMAITKSCQHPVEAAALIDFLWNGEGAAIMGSECGIPASTAGLAAAQAADAVKPLVLEANTKVLAFVDMPLDPYFESSKLKDTTDGIYTDVFDGLSYDEYDPQEAAEILLDGVSSVLSANA